MARWCRRSARTSASAGADRTLVRRNPGDVRPVGGGVSELRIDYGPGYRVYFTQVGRKIVVLLGGGTKKTQDSDIRSAVKLAEGL